MVRALKPAVQIPVRRYPARVVHPEAYLVVHEVLIPLKGEVGDGLVGTPTHHRLVRAYSAGRESTGGYLGKWTLLRLRLFPNVAPPAADALAPVFDTAYVFVQAGADLFVNLVLRRTALTLVVLTPALDQTVLTDTAGATATGAYLDEITRGWGGLTEMRGSPAGY